MANNALKAAPPLPGDVAADQAGIVSAQSSVTAAQQAEDGTILTAPSPGTIASVSGLVGQTVSGGGVSSSSSSSASSSGSSSSSSAVITLVDLTGLQVKAGFSETDVARVAVGQPATVTFPALPTEEVAAHVIQIDTTSTVVSSVVTYGVVLALDNPTSRVRPGMSASVTVVVAKANNVLHIPTAAARGSGNAGTVTVMRGGKQSTVAVAIGVRGDDSVEIDSGLAVGDQVVVSTGRASTSTASVPARTGTGGLGGALTGGGGGFGGGRGGG